LLFNIFDQYAERYDSWYQKNQVLFECEAKVIKALNLSGRGLSIGVGTGILDSQASIEIGVEPAPKMLRLASKRGLKTIRAVGEYLPFRNKCFDFSLMTVVLCFLESPEKAILEIKRVLRSNGELAICIVPKNSEWGKDYKKKGESGHVFYRHAKFYSLSELEGLLKIGFFEVISIKSTLSFLPSAIPKLEEPSENPKGRGFVCVKSRAIDC
jgi:ubiquinone/menaquinone biosynthesis C-methylase UbiE